jgi:3-isopropylmalate/(R)-2-methylmalate dehydratase small subunit
MSAEPFLIQSGIAVPMPAANVDTDVIMPKQFLKRIDRAGLRDGVFHDLRFDGNGHLRPDFILNQPVYHNAQFLVTGANFGCGSSREHAVWGLRQYGIRAIIAESFAGIFFDNAAQNGLLLITLPADQVAELSALLLHHPGADITIDLAKQYITGPAGFGKDFAIDASRKSKLLNGLDAIGVTLQHETAIAEFEHKWRAESPWLLRC